MYSSRTGITLGFHGCDRSILDDIVTSKQNLRDSKNKYDWLGHGVYFWENSYSRALEYAKFLKTHPKQANIPIENPAVIGAAINLGFCLDLTDYNNLKFLKEAYIILTETLIKAGTILPKNKKTIGQNEDLLLRDLDCAVIETLHKIRQEQKLRPYDSVRGVFWEGKELYPNAGFKEKNHIQICVRNPNCIKGYFIPRRENSWYQKV